VITKVYAVPIDAPVNVTPVVPFPSATFDLNVPGVPEIVYLHPAVVESVHLTNKLFAFAVTTMFVGGTTNCAKDDGTTDVIFVPI
jgi:hypothetical protein